MFKSLWFLTLHGSRWYLQNHWGAHMIIKWFVVFYMFTRLPKTFPIFSDVQSSPWPPFPGLTPNIPPVEGYTKTCPAPQTVITSQFATQKRRKQFWHRGKLAPQFILGEQEKISSKTYIHLRQVNCATHPLPWHPVSHSHSSLQVASMSEGWVRENWKGKEVGTAYSILNAVHLFQSFFNLSV